MASKCPNCGKKLSARQSKRLQAQLSWRDRKSGMDPGTGQQPLETLPTNTFTQPAPRPAKKRRNWLQTFNNGLLALALLITQHQPQTNDRQPDAMSTAAAAVDLLLRAHQQQEQSSDNKLEQEPVAALLQTLITSAASALPKTQPSSEAKPQAAAAPMPTPMPTLIPLRPPENH